MRTFALLALGALAVPVGMFAQNAQTETVALEAVGLSGQNEVPPVESAAGADVNVSMTFAGSAADEQTFLNSFDDVVDFYDHGDGTANDLGQFDSVTVDMTATLTGASGLTFTGGHIHDGDADESGPVVVDFMVEETTVDTDPANLSTTVTLTAATDIETAFKVLANPDEYYVNLHTMANPSGEIRAQLAQTAETSMRLQTRGQARLLERIMTTLRNIDENVAAIGRRNGLNTSSEQVVGSAN